jgi:hypothetical protein
VGNWDFIFSYSDEHSAWLGELGLPSPAVRAGNRLPTTAELEAAWSEVDKDQSVLFDGDWPPARDQPLQALKVRGDLENSLRVLTALARVCGQLFLYPDTGEPAIVVDAVTVPQATAKAYRESVGGDASWERFYSRMHSSNPG